MDSVRHVPAHMCRSSLSCSERAIKENGPLKKMAAIRAQLSRLGYDAWCQLCPVWLERGHNPIQSWKVWCLIFIASGSYDQFSARMPRVCLGRTQMGEITGSILVVPWRPTMQSRGCRKGRPIHYWPVEFGSITDFGKMGFKKRTCCKVFLTVSLKNLRS